MVVTLFDGTREPIQGKDFLIRIFDGFQNQLFDNFKPAPTTLFRLPFRDNLQDNCRVLASGEGHVDAGFMPVKLSPKAVAMVDLMLIAPSLFYFLYDSRYQSAGWITQILGFGMWFALLQHTSQASLLALGHTPLPWNGGNQLATHSSGVCPVPNR